MTVQWQAQVTLDSRPFSDRVQDLGQPRAAFGQLLALDRILGAQIRVVIAEADGPLIAWLGFVLMLESQTREGIVRNDERVRSPGRRPIFDTALARRHRPRIRQQLLGRGLADIGRDVVPFVVQVDVLILDKVAAGGSGRRIDLVGHVGIDELAVGIEIGRADMQGLMQVTHEMGEQEQRLPLVLDRERWRRGLVGQHGDRGADRRHQVVIAGALKAPVVAISLNSDVLEVERVVTPALKAVRRVRTGEPVPSCVVHHPRPLLGRPKRVHGTSKSRWLGSTS